MTHAYLIGVAQFTYSTGKPASQGGIRPHGAAVWPPTPLSGGSSAPTNG